MNLVGQGIARLLNHLFPGFWKARAYRGHRYAFWGGFIGLFGAFLYKDDRSLRYHGGQYYGDVPLLVVFAVGIGAGVVAGVILARLVNRLAVRDDRAPDDTGQSG